MNTKKPNRAHKTTTNVVDKIGSEESGLIVVVRVDIALTVELNAVVLVDAAFKVTDTFFLVESVVVDVCC